MEQIKKKTNVLAWRVSKDRDLPRGEKLLKVIATSTNCSFMVVLITTGINDPCFHTNDTTKQHSVDQSLEANKENKFIGTAYMSKYNAVDFTVLLHSMHRDKTEIIYQKSFKASEFFI